MKGAQHRGPWAEVPTDRGLWGVVRSDTLEPVRTPTGQSRTWRRRGHAWAHAETLNARERASAAEALAALGL